MSNNDILSLSFDKLRSKEIKDLKELVVTLRVEKFNCRIAKKIGKLQKTDILSKTRRQIARIKTAIREKSIGK